jgi:transposase InsO family protein
MPWKEMSVMSQRKEFVERAQQPGRKISQLCREYGISRKTAYKWLRRYEQEGEAGLQDHSRRPKHSPRRTPKEVEDRVLKLREQHPAWGGRKLHARLKQMGHVAVPQPSTITAILQRHGRIEAEESLKRKTYQRFEKDRPNEMWQMDFKGFFTIRERDCYPLTILDDHSRYLVGLYACQNQQRETVKQHLSDVFRQYGLPDRILTDNGPPWGPGHRNKYYTRLMVWLLRLGIRVLRSRPYHPQTLGKDERLHRSLQAEVIKHYTFHSFEECQAAFNQWQHVYNTQRPHEALALKPPESRYQRSLRAFPEVLPPISYPEEYEVRKVCEHGRISFRNRSFRVGKAFQGNPVGLCPIEEARTFEVYFCHQKIHTITFDEVEC